LVGNRGPDMDVALLTLPHKPNETFDDGGVLLLCCLSSWTRACEIKLYCGLGICRHECKEHCGILATANSSA
jgi:hypothetical protein